jgi:hypothetical protein
MTHLRITLSAGLLAAVLAVFPGIKKKAFAEFHDGNSLYSRCIDSEAVNMGICLSYIAGIYDTMHKNELYGYKACLPTNVTIGQIKDITVSWLQRNPQYRHYVASSLVATALYEVFPCKS